jgi:hypothetical protein
MPGKMTRRQLALAGAAASAAFAQNDASPKYTGALEGFETKVDMKDFDPVANTLELYRSAPLKLTFQATDRKKLIPVNAGMAATVGGMSFGCLQVSGSSRLILLMGSRFGHASSFQWSKLYVFLAAFVERANGQNEAVIANGNRVGDPPSGRHERTEKYCSLGGAPHPATRSATTNDNARIVD